MTRYSAPSERRCECESVAYWRLVRRLFNVNISMIDQSISIQSQFNQHSDYKSVNFNETVGARG